MKRNSINAEDVRYDDAIEELKDEITKTQGRVPTDLESRMIGTMIDMDVNMQRMRRTIKQLDHSYKWLRRRETQQEVVITKQYQKIDALEKKIAAMEGGKAKVEKTKKRSAASPLSWVYAASSQ